MEDQSPTSVQQRLPDLTHIPDLTGLESDDEDFEQDHNILKVLDNHQTQDTDQNPNWEEEKESSVKEDVEDQELYQGGLQDHGQSNYQETLCNLELGHHDQERLHCADLDSDCNQEDLCYPDMDSDHDQEKLHGPELDQDQDQENPDTTHIFVQDESNKFDQVLSENQDTEGKVHQDNTQLHEPHIGQAQDIDLSEVRNANPSPIDATQQKDQSKQPVRQQVSSIELAFPDPTNPDQEPVTDNPCGVKAGEPGGSIPAVVITQAQEKRELAQVQPGEPEASELKGPERPQDLMIREVSLMATDPNTSPVSSQGPGSDLCTMISLSPSPSPGPSPSASPSLSLGFRANPSPGPIPSSSPDLSPDPGASPIPSSSPDLSPGFNDCPSSSSIPSLCLCDASDGIDMACSDLLSLRSDTVSLCASEVTVSSRGYREQQGLEDDTRSVAASSVMSLFHRIQMEPLEKDWLRSCVLGNTAALRQLLRQDASLASKKDFITTAIHWAAKQGCLEAVDMMVCAGVDVNVRSGYTALHLASIHGHLHVVQLLINNYNAKTNIRDYHGKMAAHYWSGSTDVFNKPGSQSGGKGSRGRKMQHYVLPSRLLSRSRSQELIKLEFGTVTLNQPSSPL